MNTTNITSVSTPKPYSEMSYEERIEFLKGEQKTQNQREAWRRRKGSWSKSGKR